MFSENSRYKDVKNYFPVDSRGNKNKVKRIRFIPETEHIAPYVAKENERMDIVAKSMYDDSTKFWLICDANDEMFPYDLMKLGKTITIPQEIE
jgi:hypothetical protein